MDQKQPCTGSPVDQAQRIPPFYGKAEILEAIDKSGFALEAEIGRILRENWLVRYSEQYLDSEEQKNREIDIVALHRKDNPASEGSITARLIIECKKRDNGLIAIGERRNSTITTFDPAPLCIGTPNKAPTNKVPGPYGDSSSEKLRSCFEFLGLEQTYPAFKTQVLAHQILKIDSTDPKKIKGIDSAITDIAYPIAKATKALGPVPPWEPAAVNTPHNWTINIPLIVIRGPIWFYDVNQSPRDLSQIETLTLKAEIGHGRERYVCPILVIQEKSLTNVLQEIDQMIDAGLRQARGSHRAISEYIASQKTRSKAYFAPLAPPFRSKSIW